MNKPEEIKNVFSNHLANGIYVLADDEPCGPFKSVEEAQKFIDDCDNHAYNVMDWEIININKI